MAKITLKDGRVRESIISADGKRAYWFPDAGDAEFGVQFENAPNAPTAPVIVPDAPTTTPVP